MSCNNGNFRVKKASGHGAGHWLLQRYTAIANIVLVGWLVVSMILLGQGYYDSFSEFVRIPTNAILLALFFFNTIYHGTIGIQVVVEDYVSCKCGRFGIILFTKFLGITAFFAVIFSILNMYFVYS